MADAMDFAQQREQEDRERHISNARNKKRVFLGFTVLIAICQSRQPVAAQFQCAVLCHMSRDCRTERQTLHRRFSMRTIHCLKITTEHFEAVCDGTKKQNCE